MCLNVIHIIDFFWFNGGLIVAVQTDCILAVELLRSNG